MSVRQDKVEIAGSTGAHSQGALDSIATINAAQAADGPHNESSDFNTANSEHPLKRTVAVSIRASLNDLCLRKAKSTWSPTNEALKQILQQKRFTDLNGTSEMSGDLKSVVLHSISLASVKSTFPVAVGAQVTGVDNSCFSITGESFATVVSPHSSSTTAVEIQKDDVSLAYEFARKFPGYTSDNLAEKGVHEVSARKFVLVAADHPIVSALSENADKLQMGEISMMPEGLVKISSQLYEAVMPMVRSQVASQIKVRDMSAANISISPAEFSGWSEARSELMSEEKAALKARLETALSNMGQGKAESIREKFLAEERELEHKVDHTVHTFSAMVDISYNFLSR